MAETSVFLRHKPLTLFLFSVAVFCLCSALAQRGPGPLLNSALYCFNNNLVYNSCNGAYRLNESGELDVPPDATNEFCNGACLAETRGLLKCVHSVVATYIFNNGASIGNIRDMLNAACSSSSRRGNFNVGDYMGSETSKSSRLIKQTSVFALLLMSIGWFFLLL